MRFAFLYPTVLYFVSGSNPSNEDTPKLSEIKIKEEPVDSNVSELRKRTRETTVEDGQRSLRQATSTQELVTLGAKVIAYLKALPAEQLLTAMRGGIVNKLSTDPLVLAAGAKLDAILKDATTWGRLELSVFQLLQQELEQSATEGREPRKNQQMMPLVISATQSGTVDDKPVSQGRVTAWYTKILRANTEAPIAPGSSVSTGDFIRANINLATTPSGVQYLEMTPVAWRVFVLPTVCQSMKLFDEAMLKAYPASSSSSQQPRVSPQVSPFAPVVMPQSMPRVSPSSTSAAGSLSAAAMMPPPPTVDSFVKPKPPTATVPKTTTATSSLPAQAVAVATAGSAAAVAASSSQPSNPASTSGRTVHLSPFQYYDKLPGIAREFVHQVFAIHGTKTIEELRKLSGNDPAAKKLEEYFAAFYMLGLIDNPAFDYLIGANGRRCHETGITQLTASINALFKADQPMLMNSLYNEARTAFWCREIVMKKTAAELEEFKTTHQIEGKDGMTITAAEYASILMPRLKTLHTSTAPITYPQVQPSLPK